MKSLEDIIAQAGSDSPQFDEYLNLISEYACSFVQSNLTLSDNSDINKYLYAPLSEFTKNSGKMHRPVICLLACEAVGGNHKDAITSAAAIEHFHSACLIHDDIADKALTRRGMPAMYLEQGVGIAVNIGDLALSLVNGPVIDDDCLDDTTKVAVVSELLTMTRRTIEGQALDIGWARDGRYDIAIQDYLTMATRKTAFYSGAVPLAIGAMVGGGSDEEISALRKFGLDTGLAFQIQDDILNLIGSEEAVKKDFRNDITEGKRTLMVVHALENSTESDRLKEILELNTAQESLKSEAVEIMIASGSIKFARDYAEKLCVQSIVEMEAVIKPSVTRGALSSMANWFVSRLS